MVGVVFRALWLAHNARRATHQSYEVLNDFRQNPQRGRGIPVQLQRFDLRRVPSRLREPAGLASNSLATRGILGEFRFQRTCDEAGTVSGDVILLERSRRFNGA